MLIIYLCSIVIMLHEVKQTNTATVNYDDDSLLFKYIHGVVVGFNVSVTELFMQNYQNHAI